MAFATRLPKVGYRREHFNERTWMCYHQAPPWERVVAQVGDAGQAKPHLEHNPLSRLGVCHAIPMRKLNGPGQQLRRLAKARRQRLAAALPVGHTRRRTLPYRTAPSDAFLGRVPWGGLPIRGVTCAPNTVWGQRVASSYGLHRLFINHEIRWTQAYPKTHWTQHATFQKVKEVEFEIV